MIIIVTTYLDLGLCTEFTGDPEVVVLSFSCSSYQGAGVHWCSLEKTSRLLLCWSHSIANVVQQNQSKVHTMRASESQLCGGVRYGRDLSRLQSGSCSVKRDCLAKALAAQEWEFCYELSRIS